MQTRGPSSILNPVNESADNVSVVSHPTNLLAHAGVQYITRHHLRMQWHAIIGDPIRCFSYGLAMTQPKPDNHHEAKAGGA